MTLAHLLGPFSQSVSSIATIVFILNVILHILFAAGVAKDVGNLNRMKIPTQFVSGSIWVLATLIGGVLVLALYWLMHHSALARNFKIKEHK